MRLYQYSCVEGSSIDLRQANAVLRKRPSAVFFEAPSDLSFYHKLNSFPSGHKPKQTYLSAVGFLRETAKRYPYILSDVYVYKNLWRLWGEGHDVKIYNVDGPSNLLGMTHALRLNTTSHPHRRGTHFAWWVYVYLRERMMAENMERELGQFSEDDVGLVFLQKFHWLNVQFLRSRPSSTEIFDYYFGKIPGVTPKNIDSRVKELGIPLFTKYWIAVDGLCLR